jgi:uracil-DNA glycosylase
MPGKWGMQPRMLHMLASLGLDPRAVPASNVVFVRSSTEAMLQGEKESLLRACWPVHQAVIDALGVRVVLCFGGIAGRWVREELGA